jgi:hypothetical protein
MIDPFSFAIGTAWGLVTFSAWSIVLWDRIVSYRVFHDPRAKRELLFIVPLWGVSLAWCITLFLSVVRDVADVGSAVRGILFGFGVGLYTFAGVVAALRSLRRVR